MGCFYPLGFASSFARVFVRRYSVGGGWKRLIVLVAVNSTTKDFQRLIVSNTLIHLLAEKGGSASDTKDQQDRFLMLRRVQLLLAQIELQ